MSVEITETAKSRIKTICEQYPDKVVRFSIESGGCNGFSKVWDMDATISDDDVLFEFDNGKLVIDSVSLDIIENSVIDYKSEFTGSYFSVEIPAAQSKCGCGTSFSV